MMKPIQVTLGSPHPWHAVPRLRRKRPLPPAPKYIEPPASVLEHYRAFYAERMDAFDRCSSELRVYVRQQQGS